ncbi:DNA repair protein RecN [Abyssisolibacter fermentans]|uniref:DNA repair protein RecN n=1 Tax=Abyssisolibacter fermentans TaxID=1766203 RepID=UPI00082A429C|nr:DNA repair protein RecN [Abyssisolibacter fermentans]
MLLDINICNYAIIDKVSIKFNKGFNVITGETGAGKSIIVGALNLVLGGRFSKESVRTGCKRATVEALFSIKDCDDIKDIMQDYGIDIEEDYTILITRELYNTGRSLSRINGRTVTISMLKNIASKLVDMHSQNEHQSLTNKDKHIDFVDMLGDKKLKTLLQDVKNEYTIYNKYKQKYKNTSIDDMEKERKIELLNYQINEIDSANINKNEDELLNTEYNKLANMQNIIKNINSAFNEIDTDSYDYSILNSLNNILEKVNNSANFDETLFGIRDTIQSVIYDVQDVHMELRKYLSEIDFDAMKFEEIKNRLDYLNTLKRKYGKNIEDIFSFRTSIQKQLDEILNLDKELKDIKNNIEICKRNLDNLCTKLTEKRKDISSKLVKDINEELKEINMVKADFRVSIKQEKNYNIKGIDNVEFLISTNSGEKHKSLSKIASGGEMSRIMLAFKSILAELDNIDCLIFDEIDIGISGKTAHMVGKKIKRISKCRQIICITHLPQIAALGDVHFKIEKNDNDKTTYTRVIKLDENQRINEISRLIGGENLTEVTKNTARELLNQDYS